MTEPVDPNAYPEYVPPPPFAPQPPSPYGAPPGYGPPPAYGAAFPYGDPLPYGWPAPPPPPPSHVARNVVILSLAAVLAGIVIAYAMLRNEDSAPDRLAVPESFAGYVRSHDAAANQVESLVRGMASGVGGPMQQLFDAATVAMYEDESDVRSRLVVFALRSSALPADSGSADTFSRSLLAFMGPTVHEVAPGPHHGREQCGRTSVGAVAESACSWSDRATSGLVLSVSAANHPLVGTKLAQLVWSLRDEID
jgi:hypothetical protein